MRPFLLLQVGTVAVLWGRAWQHLFHDAPFRALLWNERLMTPLVEAWGMEWSGWVSSLQVDQAIQTAIRLSGLLYLAGGVVALLAHKPWMRRYRAVLAWCAVWLTLLAWMYWLEHWRHVAQLLEYALQIAFPLLLWGAMAAHPPRWTDRMAAWLRLSVSLTFAAHGLYALGVYPVPSSFIKMTTNILPLSEEGARVFLFVAGLLDQVVAVGIWAPLGKWRRALLAYAAVWGLLTAMARPLAWVYGHDLWHTLSRYLPMMVYRLPHVLGPLLLWWWERRATHFRSGEVP